MKKINLNTLMGLLLTLLVASCTGTGSKHNFDGDSDDEDQNAAWGKFQNTSSMTSLGECDALSNVCKAFKSLEEINFEEMKKQIGKAKDTNASVNDREEAVKKVTSALQKVPKCIIPIKSSKHEETLLGLMLLGNEKFKQKMQNLTDLLENLTELKEESIARNKDFDAFKCRLANTSYYVLATFTNAVQKVEGNVELSSQSDSTVVSGFLDKLNDLAQDVELHWANLTTLAIGMTKLKQLLTNQQPSTPVASSSNPSSWIY
ncbi:MAG: hypothetical protein AAF963_01570 [Bacteroidota bacterium]